MYGNIIETWYVPNNMTLMVIGDFSTSEMIELVKKKVWPISGRIKIPEHRTIKLNPPEKLRIIKANGMGKFPKDRQYLTMGYLLPPPVSDDFQAIVILAEFLGGRDNSF